MNLSDTFYVALCMTVLIIGVVYWFWTQNQYMQRKLNLLENIVFEMKTNLNAGPPGVPDGIGDGHISGGNEFASVAYPPPPSSEMGDDDDLLHAELQHEESEIDEISIEQPSAKHEYQVLTPQRLQSVPAPMEPVPEEEEEQIEDNLAVGGIGSGIQEFVNPDASAKASVLKTMTLKELQRLAIQKGISGTSGMRKDALIEAIRNASAAAPPSITPFEASEGTLDLS